MYTAHRSRRKLRAAAIIAAGVTSALILSACAGGGGGGGAEGEADSGTLNWWGWTPDISVGQAYIDAFNEEYPDITINYKQVPIEDWEAALRPALASPSGPDIFAMQPGARVEAFKSFAEDLTPLAEDTLGEDWEDKVSAIGVEGLSADGKLTAMSIGATYAGSVWINQDLFDKYNLTPPTTLDEWVDVCAEFKANGVGCFVQGASQEGFDQDTLQAISDSIEPGVWTSASKGDTPWTDPTIVKTLETWKSLFENGIMQDGAIGYAQYPDANNDFMSQKYAMVQMGTWYMQYATTAGQTAAIEAAGVADPKPFPIVPIPFPDVTGSGNPAAYYGDSDYGLALNTKSKNKAAARTFISWLTATEAGQQVVADKLNDIPALLGVEPNWDSIEQPFPDVQREPVQKLIADASASSESRFLYLNQDVQDAILAACTSVADGSATPEEAAATLDAAAVASRS
ncbi:ABC transporter substrate-binding protein [Amnibacterium flavum]|uniref:Carbohydrate ABC transporter substrate-binding protein n=1 Tax=Amnibacterium flavum TaxID=2173173 RepID=A0A2V1HYV2_9MICO|nr:ABC transporter substrate-binding protein [Amnibacterium flavum]PVZ95754.1 hypothetical protein DDQ50_04550 [Amnibacterium flavum]